MPFTTDTVSRSLCAALSGVLRRILGSVSVATLSGRRSPQRPRTLLSYDGLPQLWVQSCLGTLMGTCLKTISSPS